MDERWKPVVGYEGIYEVSDLGRVKRVKRGMGARVGHVLAPTKHPGGYVKVFLRNRGVDCQRLIHALVLEAFVGSPSQGEEGNHKNGVKSDNRLTNLEYTSHQENVDHSRQVLGFNNSGSRHRRARFTEADILEMRRMRASGMKLEAIANRFGCGFRYVSQIVRRKAWAHV